MHIRYRIATLIVSCVLIIIAVTTMGVSYAVWISADGSIGGDGNTSTKPSITPDATYVWAKYFNYNLINVKAEDDNIKYVEVTSFYTDGDNPVGINLSDVHIPGVFWAYKEGNQEIRVNTSEEKDELINNGKTIITYVTYRISNTIFADSTLKQLPITIHIPERVQEIETGAFVGLPNLEKVYFYNVNLLTIGGYAFAGCEKLTKIENVKGGIIKATKNEFIGCDALSGVSYNNDGTITV